MIRFSEKHIPILFAILTVLAYGLLLPFTGFYWDDWHWAWIAQFQGPQEFFPAFIAARPFLAPIFFLTTSLIPPIPLYWQIFALVIRLLAGLSAWFALDQIFPRFKRITLTAALLFLVFPGYSQHWVAFTHINQEWIPFIFYLLSFGFTARALRNPDKFKANTAIAILLCFAGVFPTEYFIGLEPMRFLFIWVMLSENSGTFRERFSETLKRWFPYLLIWLANAAWLVYFYTIGPYDSYDVEAVTTPLTLSQVIPTFLDALWKTGMYGWGQIVILLSRSLTTPSSLLTVGLIFVTFIILIFYLAKLDLSHDTSKTFAISALVIGAVGILLGRVPSFAAGLPLTLQSSNDRFMISMMLGGCLFILGLTEWLVKNARLKTGLYALLIALGIGQQFFNANIFRRDWERQQEFLWQLAWRIPALQPGTALLTSEVPVDYETDNSFTAPLNWMYAPDYQSPSDLPYAMVFTTIRLGGMLASLERDVPIYVEIRWVAFRGSTSKVVVFHMPKNGCLRVLDPARGDQVTYADQSPYLVEAIHLSDPSLILTDIDHTPKLPFLVEPEHDWCYYFAKAELARQQNDWNKAVDLMDEAQSLGFTPEDPSEWLTYIEAQAMTGNLDEAEKLTDDLLRRERRVRRGLCQVWGQVQARGPEGGEAVARQVLERLECPP